MTRSAASTDLNSNTCLRFSRRKNFIAGLRPYMLPDELGNNNGRYSLISLYYLDGDDLAGMSDAERVVMRREKIGFTFQANNLVPYLSAVENVELMLRLNKRLDKAGKLRARELLARLGLGERLNNLPGQMSGGQQQRVAIARALIHNPSLDTERAYQVVETFAGLIHEQKRVGIMVTHDLRMCEYVDRVLQMRDGKLVKIYTTHEEIMKLAKGGRD